jgi:hypothetical protein
MANYLACGGSQPLNYLAGETAVLKLDASQQHRGYLLRSPDGTSTPYTTNLDRPQLPITATDQVGNYRLQAGGKAGVDFGFSVNYGPGQTQLDRLSQSELSSVFGPLKFRLAHTREQIDRDVSAGRVGRELFPPLMLLVAIILGLEMFVSNRFYKE